MEEVRMSVSPICVKDGKKYAYVTFEEGDFMAEGIIPDCKITKNKGFSQLQVEQLELYMQRELTQLKKMAAGINVFDAFMK